MLTLNQIVSELRTIQANHKQLKSFEFVNGTFDFGASGALTYPFLGVISQQGSISGKVLTSKFNLFFADLVHKDQENDDEVWSDMQLVALDVFAEFREWLMTNNIELVGDATFSDFYESWDDEVSGWQLEITINQFYARDTCQIPN